MDNDTYIVNDEARSIATWMVVRKWRFFTPEQAAWFLEDASRLDEWPDNYVEDFFDGLTRFSNKS